MTQLNTVDENQINIPWLNVIARNTPSWLLNNFTESMIGGGFTSRIVFVYSDKKRQIVAYPADIIDSKEYADEEARLVDDLCRISEMKGEYELTKEAKAWGKEWYEEFQRTRPTHMASERYSGYIGRKHAHVHKLAMVIAASSRRELYITKDYLYNQRRMVASLKLSLHFVIQSIVSSRLVTL